MIDLKKYRKESGLTQAEFARRAGVSKQNIFEYENGKRKFSLEKKIQMLNKIGYTVDIIITKNEANKET